MAAAKSPLFAFWQHSWQQFADFARATPARMFPIEIRSYAALVGALVARRDSLGIAQETVDAVAGFSDRYTAKIEAGTKRAGKVTLGLLLGALGLKLTVSEDREALKRVRAMFKQRTPRPRWRDPAPLIVKRGGLARSASHPRHWSRSVDGYGRNSKHCAPSLTHCEQAQLARCLSRRSHAEKRDGRKRDGRFSGRRRDPNRQSHGRGVGRWGGRVAAVGRRLRGWACRVPGRSCHTPPTAYLIAAS